MSSDSVQRTSMFLFSLRSSSTRFIGASTIRGRIWHMDSRRWGSRAKKARWRINVQWTWWDWSVDLPGAVEDAFVQATIKNATKATRNKDNGAPKSENAMVKQSNGLVKADNSSTEDDTVAFQLANRIAQISQTLKSLVSKGQSRILVAKFIEQVKVFCSWPWC